MELGKYCAFHLRAIPSGAWQQAPINDRFGTYCAMSAFGRAETVAIG
jgi:hypothetical protein